jgi:hypothetical protein
MKRLPVLIFLCLSGTAFAQVPASLVPALRGTWIKDSGHRDTLVFYIDGKGVDMAVRNLRRNIRHGYSIEVSRDSARITGMCTGNRGVKLFRLDTLKKALILEDFYEDTDEKLLFIKLSDRPL